jgi:cytochrome c-type biogenesis protein CcmF
MTHINFGQIILVLSLFTSLISLVFFIASSLEKGMKGRRSVAEGASLATTGLVTIASVILMISFITLDFRFLYVFNHTSTDLPMMYRVSAFWAGNEGSFLLWLLFLSLISLAVLRKKDEYSGTVMSVLMFMQFFLIIVLLITSPFEFIWKAYPQELKVGQVPGQGAGMNPLLMDPWMVAHPPVLFIGYASAAVPFAYALASLVKKDRGQWIDRTYGWVLFTMVSLGIGIFMGGYWAYKVLGWGGYWGWDPVENSSLIPWLVVVALLHSMLLFRRKRMLHRTSLVLAILYALLVFYSTFLTRSGILADFSVHSFGESNLTLILLLFIALLALVSLVLFVLRMPEREKGPELSLTSWEQLTLFGIITLLVYAGLILTGTSMPIISGLFTEHPSPVTTDFYNRLSIPFGLIILLMMMAATMAIAGLKSTFFRARTAIFILAALGLGVLFNLGSTGNPVAYVFTITALFLLFQNFYEMGPGHGKLNRASRIAHLGVAVLVIGIIASNFHAESTQKWFQVNKPVKVRDMTITFLGFEGEERSRVKFRLDRKGKERTFSTDYYMDPKTRSLYREPYILSDVSGDIYITPEQFRSGEEGFSTAVLSMNQTVLLAGNRVTLKRFDTSGMQSGTPTIIAEVEINGELYRPGITIRGRQKLPVEETLDGTERKIIVKEIDPGGKRILLYIEPEAGRKQPPDMLIVDISWKPLIWVVWLGTLFISAGGLWALVRRFRKT